MSDMESSYKFMVKHTKLWEFAFHGTSPRWIHSGYLSVIATLYAKYVSINLILLINYVCVT